MAARKRPSADPVAQARIDAEAAALRAQRKGYHEIARTMGCSVSTAYERVSRALKAIPYEAVEELRRVELESLDELEQRCREVLLARHVKVDHGRLIVIDGEPLLDDAPVLHAAAQILRVKDMRARLTGTYAPVREDVRVTNGDSHFDTEIARLLADMGRVGEGEAPVAPSDENAQGAAEPAHP